MSQHLAHSTHDPTPEVHSLEEKFDDEELSPLEKPFHIDTTYASDEVKHNVITGHLSKTLRKGRHRSMTEEEIGRAHV